LVSLSCEPSPFLRFRLAALGSFLGSVGGGGDCFDFCEASSLRSLVRFLPFLGPFFFFSAFSSSYALRRASHGLSPSSIPARSSWWFSGRHSSQKYSLGKSSVYWLMPMQILCCHAPHVSHAIHGSPESSSCSVAPQTQRMISSSGSSGSGAAFLFFFPPRRFGASMGWSSCSKALCWPFVALTDRRGSGSGARFLVSFCWPRVTRRRDAIVLACCCRRSCGLGFGVCAQKGPKLLVLLTRHCRVKTGQKPINGQLIAGQTPACPPLCREILLQIASKHA
jgi:hypothetical protein